MIKEGERVGAILKANNDSVFLFGYGVYCGFKFQKPDDPMPVPKIELDDGRIVWGHQCWWSSEEYIKGFIGDRKVVIVEDELDA